MKQSRTTYGLLAATSEAVSSCLQAALTEHSYGSERSEAKVERPFPLLRLCLALCLAVLRLLLLRRTLFESC